jgi:hypothetical protein
VQSCVSERQAGRQVERERNPSTSARSAQTSWEARNTEKPSARNLLGTKRGLCFFLFSPTYIPAAAASSLSLIFFWTFAERKRCRQKTTKTHPLHLGMDAEAPPPYFLCLPRSPPERFPSEKIRCPCRGEENEKNQRAAVLREPDSFILFKKKQQPRRWLDK